jgi:hypothetical protein
MAVILCGPEEKFFRCPGPEHSGLSRMASHIDYLSKEMRYLFGLLLNLRILLQLLGQGMEDHEASPNGNWLKS